MKALDLYSNYTSYRTGKTSPFSTCKDCIKDSKRGGPKKTTPEMNFKKCHCCGSKFLSVSKYNILCDLCKGRDFETEYSVEL